MLVSQGRGLRHVYVAYFFQFSSAVLSRSQGSSYPQVVEGRRTSTGTHASRDPRTTLHANKHRAEVDRANDVTGRMCALLLLAHRSGIEYIIENPADRGDVTKPNLFINAEHGPLWLLPVIKGGAR